MRRAMALLINVPNHSEGFDNPPRSSQPLDESGSFSRHSLKEKTDELAGPQRAMNGGLIRLPVDLQGLLAEEQNKDAEAAVKPLTQNHSSAQLPTRCGIKWGELLTDLIRIKSHSLPI